MDLKEFAKTLSTADLETLIADLAEIRAGMAPEVSRTPPGPAEAETNVSVHDEPAIQARLLRDGRIRLWIRNPGIGWLVFNLSHEQGVTLREYFIANTDQNALPALFGAQNGNRH